MIPGLPPYPENSAPTGAVDQVLAFVILVATLVLAVSIVLLVLRSRQQAAGTEQRAVVRQTALAAGITVGVVWLLNAVVVGAINSAAVESARQSNYYAILAYNRIYANAIDEVYGIDIDADDANALLSGVEVQTELPNGDPVSIMLVDEFEPRLGLMDATTEEPIPTLADTP